MKNHPYRRSSATAALAAVAVTAVLVGSLVESFEPTQLLQISREAGSDQIASLRHRDESPGLV